MADLTTSNAVDSFMQSANQAAMRTAMGLAAVAASGSASDLSAGTLPDARFPATLPAVSGANLTNLDAAELTGTLPDATFPATLPAASGANLTALTAANLTGTIPDASFPATLPAASGANLTNLDASDLTGTVPAASLPNPGTTTKGGVKRNTGSGGQFVSGVDTDGALIFGTPSGSGDVVGPASATASNFASFDGTTGKLIADSGSSAASFATAAQGATADSALQPAGDGSALTGLTKTQVGLSNVSNDAQTKAAVVPNTAPSAGQILVGNAGGTAYAPVAASGDATLASTGAFTLATANSNVGTFANATVTVDAKGRVTAAAAATIPLPSPVITESTTSRSLTLSDAGAYIRLTNASACTITLPTEASQAWVAGTEIFFRVAAAGIPVLSNAGVTVNDQLGIMAALAQGSTFGLKKVDTNIWDLI